MKKWFPTIMSYVIFMLCGMGLVGCLNVGSVDDATQNELQSIIIISKNLIKENIALKKKFDEGKLTSAEFKKAIDANVSALFKSNEHLEKIKDSGATYKQLFWGAIGGSGGRTALHGLKFILALIPGWGVAASSVVGLLLGGSGGAAPKKE